MKVMIIDGGGRGQALAAKLERESDELWVSPGNPGNEGFATSTGVDPTDIHAQIHFAKQNKIDLTIVGSDDPLALGIVDEFEAEKLRIFGPTKAQARIEWDREFAKRLGKQSGIPMGKYDKFTDSKTAYEYALSRTAWPLFVKENGLAQGKGAAKCENPDQLQDILTELDKRNFFREGQKIVIEDYVSGLEVSHHAFCDGKNQLSIPFVARDHKQVGNGDTGPMTGGMGVVGPLPDYDMSEVQTLGEIFVEPVVRELGFKGVLFSGLKGLKDYEQNLEWNARLGDPETQVFIELMKSDLLPILTACVEGNLDKVRSPEWRIGQSVVSLVLAAPGYPTAPQKGAIIEGLKEAEASNVKILHAGTKRQGKYLITNGGRVLNIVSRAASLEVALKQAYMAAECIYFDGKPPVMRYDIGRTVLSEAL